MASQSKSLDREVLKTWQTIGNQTGEDFLTEVLHLYLEQTPLILSDLQGQLDRQALIEIPKTAHKLRGSSVNLGAHRLGELCSALEMICDPIPDWQAIRENIEQIQSEFKNVETTIREEFLSELN